MCSSKSTHRFIDQPELSVVVWATYRELQEKEARIEETHLPADT